MNRSDLKARARQSMSWAKPHVMLVTLIYGLVPAVISTFSLITSLQEYLTGQSTSSLYTSLLISAVSLIYSVVQAGYTQYSLDISRNRPSGIGTLFEFVGRPFRFIGLQMLIGLAATAAMLPFIIPVVILAVAMGNSIAAGVIMLALCLLMVAAAIYIGLGYAMAVFVAVDQPDMGAVDCMKESWHLMRGRRGEYFVLTLSFILWDFGCAAFLPLSLWVTPYRMATIANYYSLITGQLPVENRPQGETPWDGGYPPQDDGNNWMH